MAFMPKTWVGRSVQYPGRIRLIPTGENGVFDVQRAEGKIAADGDLVSDVALNDLEQRILTAILSKADGTGGAANNALALGGVGAANYPQISSGIFLPSLIGASTAGSPTYAERHGGYVRVGSLCYISLGFNCQSLGGLTGDISIWGLPFAAGQITHALNLSHAFDYNISDGIIGGYIVDAAIQLVVNAASGVRNLNYLDIGEGFAVGALSGCYIIA